MSLKVGVTGGIGSGKTLVCKVFETLGIPVFYADDEAKRVMSDNGDVRDQLKALIGRDAYEDGTLNRPYIASRIFRDRDLLKQMNAIVHPVVHEEFKTWVENQGHAPYVIEEAALLFESGAAQRLDTIVEVYASEETRIRSVCERDGVVEEKVRERMRNQMDEEEKRRLADHVILNEENEMLLPQVAELHEMLLKGSKQ